MLSKDIIEQTTREAIKLRAESPGLEFKGSGPFEPLKYAIAKAAQGMSNNRDGGYIIIGVKQKKGSVTIVQGVSLDSERTYDPEIVYEFVNRYASPPVEIQTVSVDHDNKTFIAIAVPPFTRTPTVCRLATPPGVHPEDGMRPGDVFIRPLDKIETRRVQTGAEMDDLLQIALARRVAEMFGALPDALQALLTQIGKAEAPTAPAKRQPFEDEVSDIDDYL